MDFIPFSPFVILILVVGILEQKEQPTRNLRIHITFINHVKNAKELAISLIRIKCKEYFCK
jgi:hypothetical protein